jgi:DNA-directed RNA polymerase specialized sigma24 family protein
MQCYWTFTGCDKTQQQHLSGLWQRQQSKLDSKVNLMDVADHRQIRLFAERSDESPEWTIQAALFANPCTFAAEGQGEEPDEALAFAIDSLSQMIDQFLDRSERPSIRRRDLEALVPFLVAFREQDRSREFIAMLMPIMESLGDYAQQELRARRTAAELPAEQLVANDLLDTALLHAWDRFDSRPLRQPLDLWLIHLIDAALDAWITQSVTTSLDERQPHPSPEPRDSHRSEWTDQPTTVETLKLSDLLPNEAGVSKWDALGTEQKQTRLSELLAELPRQQRQALMLYGVEGFSEAEIADFQNRSTAEITQDLIAAQASIRRYLDAHDLREIEETLERKDLSRPRRSFRR